MLLLVPLGPALRGARPGPGVRDVLAVPAEPEGVKGARPGGSLWSAGLERSGAGAEAGLTLSFPPSWLLGSDCPALGVQ